MTTRRISVTDLQRKHDRGDLITMLTAYDCPSAKLVDEAGIDLILVGDSLGMVVLGYDSTLPVTVDDMVHHGAAVVRGSKRSHVVVDMPFGSYQAGSDEAMRNAVRIMQETGAGSVKLEGGVRSAPIVERLVTAGIPVMGHVGLTPQSVNAMGGFRVQGKTPRDAVRVLADAKALEDAGAYAVVLETIPAAVGASITKRLRVPTIGIGAGPYCSGQVQVFHDLLGLDESFTPRHARHFVEGAQLLREAIERYREQVEANTFPTADESFFLDEGAVRRIEYMLSGEPRGIGELEPAHEGVDAELVLSDTEESSAG